MRRTFLFLVLFNSCGGDPVHDTLVKSLGPEPAGAPGPEHRPGEPCLACHGGSGPASKHLAVGGTIYLQQGKPDPLVGAQVDILDLGGSVVCTTKTNNAGNFFLEPPSCTMPMPAKAKITSGQDAAEMVTRIGREGSCATCHHGDMSGPTSLEKIYLKTSDQP